MRTSRLPKGRLCPGEPESAHKTFLDVVPPRSSRNAFPPQASLQELSSLCSGCFANYKFLSDLGKFTDTPPLALRLNVQDRNAEIRLVSTDTCHGLLTTVKGRQSMAFILWTQH